MIKLKITPGLIVLTLGLIFSIPATYHYLLMDNKGQIQRVGLISGWYSFLLIISLLIERTIIFKFKPALKNILIVEISLICVWSMIIALSNPTLHFKVTDDTDWFGIFYTEKQVSTKTEYLFPHDKILNIIANDILFINKNEFERNKKEIEAIGTKWDNYIHYDKEYNIGTEKVFCSIYLSSGRIPSDSLLQYVGTILANRFR
jgi:hypothetical protein